MRTGDAWRGRRGHALLGALECALLGALFCTQPAYYSAPIPEWDQCAAAAVRFGGARIESESSSERDNQAGASCGGRVYCLVPLVGWREAN